MHLLRLLDRCRNHDCPLDGLQQHQVGKKLRAEFLALSVSCNLRAKWVKAHSGLKFNERADALADLGRMGHIKWWSGNPRPQHDPFSEDFEGDPFDDWNVPNEHRPIPADAEYPPSAGSEA